MTFRTEQLAEGKVTLHCGDCLDVFGALEANSVDAGVTDPPYGLGFMGKAWDHGVPGVRYWKAVYRVLKPGAHLLAFGGTRTFGRMHVAIEDAGFEIRDMISWLYGSGFPKSHDVSKAIDRTQGEARQQVRVPAAFVRNPKATGAGRDGTEGATRPWIEEALERGYHEKDGDEPVTDAAREWSGFGTALKPACEPIVLARKPLEGTVAQNVLKWGVGALNIDGCRVATDEGLNGGAYSNGAKQSGDASSYYTGTKAGEFKQPQGRWPANVILSDDPEVQGAFPETGDSSRSVVTSKPGGIYGGGAGLPSHTGEYGFDDSGSAARFFYTAKADSDDRLGSKHPTVKPLSLMQYLVRLVVPPKGLCLDPFAGTGTTGEACIREGFRAILIEREAEYQEDIRRRMRLAMCGPSEREREAMKARMKDRPIDPGPLFGGTAEAIGGGA